MGIVRFRKAVFGASKGGAVLPHEKAVLEGVCRLVDYARHGDERWDQELLKDAVAMLRL
jgi:cullin-4